MTKDYSNEFVSEKEAMVYLIDCGLTCKDVFSLVDRLNLSVIELANSAAEEKREGMEIVRHFDDKLAGLLKTALKSSDLTHGIVALNDYIAKSRKQEKIRTGFASLDRYLGGGLFPGLYVIGAQSSLGKTTFVWQIANNIAATGHDVLYVSLEMATEELAAKSISRETYELKKRKEKENMSTLNELLAKTTREILDGHLYDEYSETEMAVITESMEECTKYSARIRILSGLGDISVVKTDGCYSITEEVAKLQNLLGKVPVIIVDYLQILAPYYRSSEKQNMDYNIVALKRLSRDFDTPVICVSSFNRDSYDEPLSMKSYKESGAIEYTADVLIGLQYAGMDCNGEKNKTEYANRVYKLVKENEENGNEGRKQDIEVKILKNRNGMKGGKIIFNLYSKYNFFEEQSK